jgi:hypothetical protein
MCITLDDDQLEAQIQVVRKRIIENTGLSTIAVEMKLCDYQNLQKLRLEQARRFAYSQSRLSHH